MSERFKIYTLAEALESLKGVCGRTRLLDHLNTTPQFEGGPTHRRAGRKYVFYPDDLVRLRESLCRSRSLPEKEARTSISAVPSEERLFLRVQELATRPSRKKSARNAKPNSGNVVSMAPNLSRHSPRPPRAT